MKQTPEMERAEWDRRATENADHEACSDLHPVRWNASAFRPLSMIVPRVPDTCATILEIGVGPGRIAAPMVRFGESIGARFIGVDVSPVMVDAAARRLLLRYATLLVGDGRTLPMGSETVDLVYSVTVFQHLPLAGVKAYIREALRVLTPGGRLVCQFVEGDENVPFGVQHEPQALFRFALEIGLAAVEVEDDPWQSNWRWLYATKPV